MLEIGIDTHKSVLLWLTYFPGVYVFGLEIEQEWIKDRVTCIKGDQSNKDDLKNTVQKIKEKELPLRLIVDDGAHTPEC